MHTGELIEVMVKPRRPLMEGYGYKITVTIGQESEETPGLAEYVGTPTVYVY